MRAAGAAAVVDDHGLPERLAERVGEHARGDVGRAAGRGGHDQA